MTDASEINVAEIQRNAEMALTNSAYRRKYETADFLTLNRFQSALLDAVSRHRFVLGQAGGQIGKSTVAMKLVNDLVNGRATLENRSAPTLERPYKLVIWILSETGQTTILGPQTRLLGDTLTGAIGTGLLRLPCIKKLSYAHGVPGLVSEAVCEMPNGDLAIIRFRQYQQGKQALTSESVDLIVCDELPPDKEMWAELLQRVSATAGTILVVATPGRQSSDIIAWFKESSPDRAIVRGSVDDATHFSQTEKQAIAAAYRSVSEAEFRSRYFGDEFVGGGRVFRFDIADLAVDYPEYLSPAVRFILGVDINHGGLSPSAHPHGVVLCGWLPDVQELWVLKEYREKVDFANLVAAILMIAEGDLPCAWGHDMAQGVAGTSETYRDMLARLGLRMLPKPAAFDNGSHALEPQIDMLQELMTRGKLKIVRTCRKLFEELQNMERDGNGRILPVKDDLVAALRYAALMAPRHSRAFADLGERHGLGRRYAPNTEAAKDADWCPFCGRFPCRCPGAQRIQA